MSVSDGTLTDSRLEQRRDPQQATAATGGVVPLTSRFVLNGAVLEYGARGFVALTSLNGDARDGTLSFSATQTLQSSLSEGVEGTLFRRRQTGWYLQFDTVDRTRTITTTRREAVDILGSRTVLTLTGGCIAPGSAPGSLCTYTPGVTADPDSIDPDTLVPTSFTFSTAFQQEIDEATHLALQAPGFQRGVPGGEEVGIDLDLPNAGFTFSEARAGGNSVTRRERVQTRPIITLSRVEQNLFSNDQGAALDRTVRGFVLLEGSEWTDTAIAFQALAWVLPSLDATLAPGEDAPNLRISNNLFLAANNLRLPRDSYTVFSTSRARVGHRDTPAQTAAETPVAWAEGVWLGFSPVRDVSRSSRLSFLTTGPRITTSSEFAEGGFDDALGDLIDGTITIIDLIDNQISEIEFSNIGDLYVQVGTDITSQEAIRRITTTETWRYRYVPHLSLTSNRTSGQTVLRYYTGALLDDDANAYAGFDISYQGANGWSSYFRADAYTRPDRDYYSAVEGRLSRAFRMEGGQTLTLGMAALASIDRPDAEGDLTSSGSGTNTLDLVALWRDQGTEYSVRQRFSDIGTDADAASTSFGLTHQINPRMSVSGQVTPFSNEESFIRAQAGFSWNLDDGTSPATFRMQWARIDYDYGRDGTGRDLDTSENIFLASFRTPL
ncbi:hypothetical protein [Halodurantibacterium flavum]|uniref:TIGR03016 family PEP-CTERM system-associated outer membrane protein n=1 Tax=Halodurantibacterium flavum TaxID=1382802 RepID=A0ABW4S177_9RHOB